MIRVLLVIWIFQKLTSDMDFSEVNFVDVYAGGNLEIRTEVIGNDTGNISFSMVNVILKRYNL